MPPKRAASDDPEVEPRPAKSARRSERLEAESKAKADAEAEEAKRREEEYEKSGDKARDEFRFQAGQYTNDEHFAVIQAYIGEIAVMEAKNEIFNRGLKSRGSLNLFTEKAFRYERVFPDKWPVSGYISLLRTNREKVDQKARDEKAEHDRKVKLLKDQIHILSHSQRLLVALVDNKTGPFQLAWVNRATLPESEIRAIVFPDKFGGVEGAMITAWQFLKPFKIRKTGTTNPMPVVSKDLEGEAKKLCFPFVDDLVIHPYPMIAYYRHTEGEETKWHLRNHLDKDFYIQFGPTVISGVYQHFNITGGSASLLGEILDFLYPEMQFPKAFAKGRADAIEERRKREVDAAIRSEKNKKIALELSH